MRTYTSADFEGSRTANHTLLIRAGEFGNAVAVVDNRQRLQFVTEYGPAEIPHEMQALLQSDYSAVRIGIPNGRFAFIPAEVFDDAEAATYKHYLPDDGLAALTVADIADLDIKLVHQTPPLGLVAWQQRFPQARIHPNIEAMLGSLSGYGRQTEGTVVAVDRYGSFTSICVFHKGKFVYGNDFETHSAGDLNYYLLKVLRHLGVETAVSLYLSGDVEQGDPYHQHLSKYTGEVVFADTAQLTGITIPDELLPVQHRFLTLIGLLSCV